MTQPDADDLVRWKFNSDARRRANALRGINGAKWPNAEKRIAEALEVAHSCPGLDLPPLLILSDTATGVGGWGAAMGSAVLAACFPNRFTVGDTRALSSVQELSDAGHIPVNIPRGADFAFLHWEPYLAACRWIAGKCRCTLREIDQALWAADGNGNLPG